MPFPQINKEPLLYGSSSSIASSGFKFVLQFHYPKNQTYEIDWVTKIGAGLSREVYRIDIILDSKGNEEIDNE